MPDMADQKSVLVMGATGAQGGCVVAALTARGVPVRALVRDVDKARAVLPRSVQLFAGSFDDHSSLARACEGAGAVFSMQNAPYPDPDSERREGRNIIAAARQAGVAQLVHTSVSGAGRYHRAMPGWGTGRWNENYWNSKSDVEDLVRAAGFASFTILKPAFMMENFTRPKADGMFPDLVDDRFVTAFHPHTRLVLVAAEDVGIAVAAAVLDPARFNGAEIELAGDARTMHEIAAILSAATGRHITATTVTPAEAVARGQFPGWVNSQEWTNEVPYPATPDASGRYGLQPIDLARWAELNAARVAHR